MQPKIIFSEIPIKLEMSMFKMFLFDGWGWGRRIIKLYPELKKALKIKNNKKHQELIYNFLINFRFSRLRLIVGWFAVLDSREGRR